MTKQTLLDKRLELIWHDVVENTHGHVIIENRIEHAIAEFLFKLLKVWIPVRVENKFMHVPMTDEMLRRANNLLKESVKEKEIDKKLEYFQKREDKRKIEEILFYLRSKRNTIDDKELRSAYNEACDRLDVLESKLAKDI
jgi:hypothetical protein